MGALSCTPAQYSRLRRLGTHLGERLWEHLSLGMTILCEAQGQPAKVLFRACAPPCQTSVVQLPLYTRSTGCWIRGHANSPIVCAARGCIAVLNLRPQMSWVP
jgi:hypothetical protein